MSAHENLEHAEHAQHVSQASKKIALLISVLALFLAFSETLGKNAQTSALNYTVAVNDLWAFYQAKHIRSTILRTGAEQMRIDADRAGDPALQARLNKTIENWLATADRYDNDPKGGEGRKQIMAKAQATEHKRELVLARYHHYEVASAAFQIGIVLASAEVITAIAALGWLAGLVGVAGLAFTAVGLWAPHAVHLF